MENGNFVAHREWQLINLEFSLFFSERMWLHYSLLCCCHSSSVVASPLLVSTLKTASALSCQKTAKLFLTSFLCYYVNIFRITAVMVLCENTTPPLPILCASPHRFPIYFSICKGKWNQTRSAVFLVPNSFPMWMGLTVGLCHDYPKQSNPGRGTADWSGAAPSIIIITLKDLHWAERRESGGPLSHSCADSALCWSEKQGIALKHMGMAVPTNA